MSWQLSAFSRQPSARWCDNAPRTSGAPAWRPGFGRSGFTLIEMLVSLAVISLAMAIVGIVFAITVKTAGQSAAYSEVHNWVRQFTDQIEEDLRYCDPSQSILVLVGRTQAAALTADDLAAGRYHRVLIGNPQDPALSGYDPEGPGLDANGQYSDPRADLLMFFSNRPTTSVAPYPGLVNDPYAAGAKFSPIRVVYGHAALTDAVWNGGTGQYDLPTDPGLLRHIEQTVNVNGNAFSRIPANRWHLSRVATILVPPPSAGTVADTQFTAQACWNVVGGQPYGDKAFGTNLPGDAAYLNVPYLLGVLGVNWALMWSRPPALEDPYNYTLLFPIVNSLVYGTFDAYPATPHLHHVATVLEDVPVELSSNMGVHMLPGCAWFQVEFLMPEDPRNSMEYMTDPSASGMSQRSDMPRWTSINANPSLGSTTYVFVPDTQANRQAIAGQVDAAGVPYSGSRLATFGRLDQDPNGDVSHPGTAVSNRVIRLWPYAIRVTVRVWDARGRLTEPIVRSIVHRFE
jgi:prepilin-type N-terminal cleavage/methylation domain-containing protein